MSRSRIRSKSREPPPPEEEKEKKSLQKPGPAACIEEGSLTSKLARASSRRPTGPAKIKQGGDGKQLMRVLRVVGLAPAGMDFSLLLCIASPPVTPPGPTKAFQKNPAKLHRQHVQGHILEIIIQLVHNSPTPIFLYKVNLTLELRATNAQMPLPNTRLFRVMTPLQT
eukprot:1152075-Pelagomonas_calceolata.AAC.2